MQIAKAAMIPPRASDPVSPIKTCAGYELYHRKATHAPTNAALNTTSSSDPGIYMILRYSAINVFELTYARMASVIPIIALVPVANPSNPSVRFAPFDTAVTMSITMGMKTIHTHTVTSSMAQSINHA